MEAEISTDDEWLSASAPVAEEKMRYLNVRRFVRVTAYVANRRNSVAGLSKFGDCNCDWHVDP